MRSPDPVRSPDPADPYAAHGYALVVPDDERRRLAVGWLSLGLGLLAPWLVELLAAPEFQEADTVVAPLAFSGALLVAYTTLSIAASRANRTERFWQVALADNRLDKHEDHLVRRLAELLYVSHSDLIRIRNRVRPVQ